MGTDQGTSVTDLEGRFHHVANAYVAGPALFPTVGSAGPVLTGLALARRTAQAIAARSLAVEPGFRALGTGGLSGWRMAGAGRFVELGANIIESIGGPGLLWYTREQFTDFILRVEWQVFFEDNNSGIFIRLPAPDAEDHGNGWKAAVAQGYQIQIDDSGRNTDTEPAAHNDPRYMTGAIYGLADAKSPASKPPQQWNLFEITANGNTITVRLNGKMVSELPDANRLRKGYIGLQNHAGSRIQFRKLQIQPL
jgi:hypothetical protein